MTDHEFLLSLGFKHNKNEKFKYFLGEYYEFGTAIVSIVEPNKTYWVHGCAIEFLNLDAALTYAIRFKHRIRRKDSIIKIWIYYENEKINYDVALHTIKEINLDEEGKQIAKALIVHKEKEAKNPLIDKILEFKNE